MMLTGSLAEGEPLLAASEPQKDPRLQNGASYDATLGQGPKAAPEAE